jgi:D-alanyl-lipoteichoic acid acyltransferase DltB (MBOAT superfamily)
MLFNSVEYAIFLPLVFIFYWFILEPKLPLQNLFVLLASYLFYGWLQWKLLSLLFITTVVDYFVALALNRTTQNSRRKALIIVSITANLSLLGFFKYYNFFIENFITGLSWLGIKADFFTLSIILPAGISFYTFQTMSYTIDVYRRKLTPTKDFIAFAAFVSFFPQLVAGPIERAEHLLPQFLKKRRFDQAKAVDGLKQMLWGFFKKIVIADNCGRVVDLIYANSHDYTGSALLLAGIFFTIQVYCDFSAYSDIAIGSGRLFGFELMQNFAFPYFSRNIGEFWRRWHISLYSWFRDYVYIPLGGGQGSKGQKIRNVFIIFLLSGFWHGASWNFILWGLLNALYLLPSLLSSRHINYKDTVAPNSNTPSITEVFQMGRTFLLILLSMMVFRAKNFHEAVYMVTHSVSGLFNIGAYRQTIKIIQETGYVFIALVIGVFVVEWFGRRQRYALEKMPAALSPFAKYAFYYSIILIIILLGNFGENKFIYFQF